MPTHETHRWERTGVCADCGCDHGDLRALEPCVKPPTETPICPECDAPWAVVKPQDPPVDFSDLLDHRAMPAPPPPHVFICARGHAWQPLRRGGPMGELEPYAIQYRASRVPHGADDTTTWVSVCHPMQRRPELDCGA